ncbi:MAG TPA: ribosome maturation factor RimM [Solirubrobacteraceae bacterium]|nr:ribosome maturation factor RimM [Solirubrobacteraceae bacterium]
MSSSTSSTEHVEAGHVGRAHGLDGSFHVTRPRPDLLTAGRTVLVAGQPREIERRAGTDARPILRLRGSTSREDADALRGQPLLVARTELPDLGPDEWWPDQLVGCRVVDGAAPVGVVTAVTGLPSCDVLEVDRDGSGAILLVPLVRDAVRSVDVAARRIDVDLGFVEGG